MSRVLQVLLICSILGLGLAGSCGIKPVPFPYTDGVEEIKLIRETLQDIAATLSEIGEGMDNIHNVMPISP